MAAVPRVPARLLLVGLLALGLACACGRTSPPPEPGPRASGSWFVLRHGLLERLPGAPDASALSGAARSLPWTVQARVADLSLRGGTLYVAVNGYGLASSPFPPPATSRFSTAYSEELFAGRTLTEILADPSGMLLHLYVDRTLAAPAQATPAPRGGPVCLVAVRQPAGAAGLSGASYEPLAVPFHSGHPTWEAVAMVRTTATELCLEWKRSGDARTEFAYTRFAWRTGAETVIDRRTFRDAYGFGSLDSPQADPAVRAVYRAVIERPAPERGRAGDTALHLVVRAEGAPAERYRHQPPGYAASEAPDLVTVPARWAGGSLWALAPAGALLRATAGGQEVRALELPALPPSCRYTGFVVGADGGSDWVAASWEEIDFTRVGAAGLYVGPAGSAAP